MTNSDISNKRCRKCGSPHLQTYADGSGYCRDCNDTFANINKYEPPIEVKASNQDNFDGGNRNPPTANKKKSSYQYESICTYIFFISGLGFIVLGLWHLLLSFSFGMFSPHIIILIVCGCLFILSAMSIYDGYFKRASYSLIIISILLFISGIILIYIELGTLDAFCVCPISFLLFIVISAFILLRMDKGVKK